VAVGLDEADRVAARQRVAVLGQRVRAEVEVRERVVEAILLLVCSSVPVASSPERRSSLATSLDTPR
jgi:hypothetical protein